MIKIFLVDMSIFIIFCYAGIDLLHSMKKLPNRWNRETILVGLAIMVIMFASFIDGLAPLLLTLRIF